MNEIVDKFVDFLITELCEGCTECEPRLDQDWQPNFACCTEGKIKWLLDFSERYKNESKTTNRT